MHSTFDAIQIATKKGITVIEGAGNGSMDLDSPKCYGRFDRTESDSGAIIVGAGKPPITTNPQNDYLSARERMSFSSFGSRVDLQAWGNQVFAAGFGGAWKDPAIPTTSIVGMLKTLVVPAVLRRWWPESQPTFKAWPRKYWAGP